jgi:3-deoxy-D-manno-octulosonic-acid transferase
MSAFKHPFIRTGRVSFFFLCLLYTGLISILYILVYLYSQFNKRLNKQLENRNTSLWLEEVIRKKGQKECVLFYCCSAGEFEQAAPIAQFFANKAYFVHFLFQSNSGIKHMDGLKEPWSYSKTPFDYFWNWKRIMKRLNPVACILVKHEFWPGFMWASARYSHLFVSNLTVSHGGNGPSICVRNSLLRFSSRVFLAHRSAFDQLDASVKKRALYTGDTKLERCQMRRQMKKGAIEKLEAHIVSLYGDKNRMILGSAYEKDVECVLQSFCQLKMEGGSHWQVVVVPHDPTASFISFVKALSAKWELSCSLFSQELADKPDVLLVDRYGILFDVYASGKLAFLGGGFDGGVHNTIEPSVYGMPICCGPNIQNEVEAYELIGAGHLTLVSSSPELTEWWRKASRTAPPLSETFPANAVLIGQTILSLITNESDHPCQV